MIEVAGDADDAEIGVEVAWGGFGGGDCGGGGVAAEALLEAVVVGGGGEAWIGEGAGVG